MRQNNDHLNIGLDKDMEDFFVPLFTCQDLLVIKFRQPVRHRLTVEEVLQHLRSIKRQQEEVGS